VYGLDLHTWFGREDETDAFVCGAIETRLVHPGLTEMDPRWRPAKSGTKGVKRYSNTVLNPRGVDCVLHPVTIYQAEPVRVYPEAVAAAPCRSDLILEFAQDKIGTSLTDGNLRVESKSP
jgi:hypothetical protein